ncbi:hypothetical protein MSG37_16255 [Shewanella sp. 1CM18E]|uniref:hypothetical protein n=1 Tax=Shewanella sp. 1CM18E TaxID=2929169 RepID=UPI0020BF8BCC|nr:hypothetical protein [Shewanella sp. 1CM18E]MCK8046440.1 hypothetical protein [Shewanella sp. 1CM18E]
MEIVLQDPSIAWSKFSNFVWFSVLAIILSYTVIRIDAYRKMKKLKAKIVMLKCGFLPLLLLYAGYTEQLNRFYALAINDNGVLTLRYVFPKGKHIWIEDYRARVSRDGARCSLNIFSDGERLKSVMVVNTNICREAVQAVESS